MARDIHWVHLEQQHEWVWASTVAYERNGAEQWGTATIAGEVYTICWSHDGDGYTQMTDQDIDRYHLHQKQRAALLTRLSEYTLEKLQSAWLIASPYDALNVASDWARVGFATIEGRPPRKTDRGVLMQAGVTALHRFLCQPSLDMGLLYTFGYTMPYADALIEQFMALGIIVADIRYAPNSRAAKWREAALRTRLGDLYLPMRELGNVNYNRPGDIELYRPESGVVKAGQRLQQGQHLAFMCMCPEVEGCHREVAAEHMQEQFPTLNVIHF